MVNALFLKNYSTKHKMLQNYWLTFCSVEKWCRESQKNNIILTSYTHTSIKQNAKIKISIKKTNSSKPKGTVFHGL